MDFVFLSETEINKEGEMIRKIFNEHKKKKI